jgi:hypothetical protein
MNHGFCAQSGDTESGVPYDELTLEEQEELLEFGEGDDSPQEGSILTTLTIDQLMTVMLRCAEHMATAQLTEQEAASEMDLMDAIEDMLRRRTTELNEALDARPHHVLIRKEED